MNHLLFIITHIKDQLPERVLTTDIILRLQANLLQIRKDNYFSQRKYYYLASVASHTDALVGIPIRDDKCLDSDQSVGTFIGDTCTPGIQFSFSCQSSNINRIDFLLTSPVSRLTFVNRQ